MVCSVTSAIAAMKAFDARMDVIAIVVVVFLPMLIEAIRAARNERAQRARGGIEPPGDVYRAMQIAYPAGFAVMIAERSLRGSAPAAMLIAGVLLFVGAKALKGWAIATLGQSWTFRVIVVPGTPLVRRGPYRWLRHPNYLGVVGEFVAVAAMCGAIATGPIVTAAFGLLVWRRIRVEERALDAILAPGSRPARAAGARHPSNAP